MKKRFQTMMMVVLIISLLAACTATATQPPAVETEDVSEGSVEKLKVVLVLPQKLGDAGPMDDMNVNLQKAATDFDIDYAVFEATEASQYEEVLRTYAREDVDLIVTSMPAMVEATRTVASEFPNVKFTILFPLNTFDLPNVNVVDFAIWEAYYLAGILAGSLTDTYTVGHGIGAEQSALLANYHAFTAGAQSINPDIEVMRVNANTFDDPAKGKDIGISMAGQGADIVVTDLASTGLGVIEAAEEVGFFVIGDSSPHHDLSPSVILGDTLCKYGPALYSAIANLVNGTWVSGIHHSNLAEGGVGLSISPRIAEFLTDEQKERFETASKIIEEKIDLIVNGSLTVEYNPNP